ncbi:hypothetical protein D187_003094 [Cystobacter fuscus DSM 2262]|uniref:Uncharacterized protein n=1 Tax=Cystobacter fuscus (strain ATCC 25194 / DSM 2262 / NBRC 100088 / M29) TaxID=1242864 RepID=S9P422_CYSF2|nr:hypothetical protein D187_003094 [Cystobacter fuscus DSM 2262]
MRVAHAASIRQSPPTRPSLFQSAPLTASRTWRAESTHSKSSHGTPEDRALLSFPFRNL